MFWRLNRDRANGLPGYPIVFALDDGFQERANQIVAVLEILEGLITVQPARQCRARSFRLLQERARLAGPALADAVQGFEMKFSVSGSLWEQMRRGENW